MPYTDSHIHSCCSPDAYDTMLDMALASRKLGADTLCFTDHCDLDETFEGKPDPDCFSKRWDIINMYEETRKSAPKDMTIRLGIELGEINHDPARAAVICASEELDFVLGSIHNLKGKPDFYGIEYRGEEHCRALFDEYMDESLELAALPYFDVMAHLGYPVHYSRLQGYDLEISLNAYREKMERILKTLISGGRGIEINCSGFRTPPGGGEIPTRDTLRRYRELGGEIITVGSDAHETAQAGVGLKEGYALLKELGFKYVTVFEKRKPLFIKI